MSVNLETNPLDDLRKKYAPTALNTTINRPAS